MPDGFVEPGLFEHIAREVMPALRRWQGSA
jgi:hypothetical protein